MREIKFRCWRISIKEMYPPASIWKMNLWGCDFTDDIILMQYTGLKDKNGKEIYEGDILKSKDCGFRPKATKNLVEWDEELSAFMPFAYDLSDDGSNWIDRESMEIIGNIYENPELDIP